MKIGLLTGQGQLPHYVISGAKSAETEIIVICFNGITEANDYAVEGKNFGLAEFGAIIKYLKQTNCTHVCMAGNLERPDFTKLKPDIKALKYLPGALSASKKGDDALLSYLLLIFEKQGFDIISPQELCQNLLVEVGLIGTIKVNDEHRDDILKACEIARDMGARDIGQGAVVCNGLVLAVEAQEGTDNMLKRIASLPEAKRGNKSHRQGVLAKMVKPGQDERVDLPTIGLRTVELAVQAGLAGIVVESGQAFLIDKQAAVKVADESGIFILGIPSSKAQ